MLVAFLYEVGSAERPRFEQVYGPDGEWAAFFRADAGYLGTELHRSPDDPSRYLVVDRWGSRAAYSGFLERHREEYDRRSRAAEGLYRRETPLGGFLPAKPAAALTLELLPGAYAACRLDARARVPDWAEGGELCSVTRTGDELSVVCPEDAAPSDVKAERGWRCLRVAGPLDFGMTGVAATLSAPLATARIPLLLIASYDTDHLLLQGEHLERAGAALRAAGHRVVGG